MSEKDIAIIFDKQYSELNKATNDANFNTKTSAKNEIVNNKNFMAALQLNPNLNTNLRSRKKVPRKTIEIS